MEYKQGKRGMGLDGEEGLNDMYHENTMLNSETGNLRTRVKAMQETIDVLTAKNAQLLAERETGNWIGNGDSDQDITGMIAKYMAEIEELRTKLLESENLCEQLRKESTKQKRISANFGHAKMPWLADSSFSNEKDESGYSVNELIGMAKQELEKKQEKVRRSSNQTGKKEDEEKEAEDGKEADDEGRKGRPGFGGGVHDRTCLGFDLFPTWPVWPSSRLYPRGQGARVLPQED